MMDFENILSIASQNQGLSSVQNKRYSLQTGPAKKDPKAKRVDSSAVQAFLKKQALESKKKELQMRKRKDELLAKRVELKSDRKARAMASRTKDNFKGYNGVPMEEPKKKKRSIEDTVEGSCIRNPYDQADDEDNYEYEQTDSEPEPELQRSGKVASSSSSKPSSKKPDGQPKPAPPPMNFADLLKLAEKKQFEPVELKAKPVKNDERPRTADEIRELELERRVKRLDKGRDSRPERGQDTKPQSSSSSVKKNIFEKEQRNGRQQKISPEKPTTSSGSGKKQKLVSSNDRSQGSSKPSLSSRDRDRDRQKTSHSDRDRPKTSLSSSAGALKSKLLNKGATSQVPEKQLAPRLSSGQKSSSTSDFNSKRVNSLSQGNSGAISLTKPPSMSLMGQKSQQGSSGHPRPSQGILSKVGSTGGGHKPGKGESLRPGSNSMVKSNNGGPMRSSSKPVSQTQMRPSAVPQARSVGSSLQGRSGGGGIRPHGSGTSRPSNSGIPPRQPAGNVVSGHGRPKCTVVSETISSKNLGRPRPGVPPQPGMPQRPGIASRQGIPPRPMMRPPVTNLPPITSAYKRKYEDEEDYDSEMDDFIDDEGDEQSEISKHIREIFGYDRSKYKEESDYALKFMESSWRDQQKEEARSLRMAVQEDLEEEKKEKEEIQLKSEKKKKLK
ncbi:protein SPT2 homolog [Lampris incognitus]|uniref:protein SPT2 homolog n=1 Tax=Lampris incognitus TaxID=2546036 RepID=UPI0024B5C4B2|nr:protein SPT2 homolog [Lampris incognitus]